MKRSHSLQKWGPDKGTTFPWNMVSLQLSLHMSQMTSVCILHYCLLSSGSILDLRVILAKSLLPKVFFCSYWSSMGDVMALSPKLWGQSQYNKAVWKFKTLVPIKEPLVHKPSTFLPVSTITFLSQEYKSHADS